MKAAPLSADVSRIRVPRRPVGPGAAEAIGWIGLCVFLAGLPLAAALVRPVPPARGFGVEFAVALGFVALAMLGSLVLLIGMTLWRQPLGLSYEWWRATHGILAILVVFIGLVHVLRVGYDVSVPWKQALWVGVTGGAMLLLVHTRAWSSRCSCVGRRTG